jgi:hypothetical protein
MGVIGTKTCFEDDADPDDLGAWERNARLVLGRVAGTGLLAALSSAAIFSSH